MVFAGAARRSDATRRHATRGPGAMKIKGRGLLLVAACGFVESVIWVVLGLLGVLIYKCVFELPDSPDPALLFGTGLARYYIADDTCGMNVSLKPSVTPPEGVLVISSIVIATNFLWVVASILLIWEAFRVLEDRRHWVLWCWVAIAGLNCIGDLGFFVNFTVDYSNTVSTMRTVVMMELGVATMESYAKWLTFSAFMMSMAARGYVLWLLNISAALWVGFQALGGGCYGSDKDESTSLKHHFLSSLYDERGDKTDGLSAPWAVQSPVVGNMPRPAPWASLASGAAMEIPRPFRLGPPPPGRARSNTIPEPDYDNESLSREPPPMGRSLSREPPQMSRPLSRELPQMSRPLPPESPPMPHAKDALRRQPPPLDEMPRRSALKKGLNPQSRFSGKTVF